MTEDNMIDKLDELFEEETNEGYIEEENSNKDIVSKGKEIKLLTDADRDIAEYRGLVPSSLKYCKFDIEKIKRNLYEIHKKDKKSSEEIEKLKALGIKQLDNTENRKIVNFDSYKSICNTILAGMYFGNIPNRSYIIGAPDGSGKTSMVYESIMVMSSKGMRVAPYRTLWELAMLKSENEINASKNIYLSKKQVEFVDYKSRISAIRMALNDAIIDKNTDRVKYLSDILNYNINNLDVIKSVSDEVLNFKDYNKNNNDYNRQRYSEFYSLEDYLNAECLFCCLSDFSSREIETHMLDFILRSREIKGLPTIVITKESIEGYKKDKNIGDIWQQMITNDSIIGQYGKLYHISTYIIN